MNHKLWIILSAFLALSACHSKEPEAQQLDSKNNVALSKADPEFSVDSVKQFATQVRHDAQAAGKKYPDRWNAAEAHFKKAETSTAEKKFELAEQEYRAAMSQYQDMMSAQRKAEAN